jgi:hypothetical protein
MSDPIDVLNTPAFSSGFGSVNGKTPVYGVEGEFEFTGEEGSYLNYAHDPALELANGTYAMTFNATEIFDMSTLFSKDHTGFEDGGHLGVYVKDAKLHVRLQSDTESKTETYSDELIYPGKDYHVAVSFGEDGLKVYLNGKLAIAEPDYTVNMVNNKEGLVIGANSWKRDDVTEAPRDQFEGTINDVAVYDEQLEPTDVMTLAGSALGVTSQDVVHI